MLVSVPPEMITENMNDIHKVILNTYYKKNISL